MVLMTLGLISAIVALTIEEFASAALNAQEKAALEVLFYGAAGLCVVGALVFSVRVFLAKRRHSGRSLWWPALLERDLGLGIIWCNARSDLTKPSYNMCSPTRKAIPPRRQMMTDLPSHSPISSTGAAGGGDWFNNRSAIVEPAPATAA